MKYKMFYFFQVLAFVLLLINPNTATAILCLLMAYGHEGYFYRDIPSNQMMRYDVVSFVTCFFLCVFGFWLIGALALIFNYRMSDRVLTALFKKTA